VVSHTQKGYMATIRKMQDKWQVLIRKKIIHM
jgi:hypothetical protein